MSRVLDSAMAALDLRFVLLAVLVSTATAITALQCQAQAEDARGRRRLAWRALAGAGAAAGVWAAHFLMVRAYDWGSPTSYQAWLVVAALCAGAVAAMAAFAVAAGNDRWHAAAGGSVLGAGMVATHVLGLEALDVTASVTRQPLLAVPIHVAAVALACAAMLARRAMGRRTGIWAAAGLMTLATTTLHLAGLGAISVVADPAIAVPASHLGGTALAVLVGGVTCSIMITAHAATLASSQSARFAQRELRLQQELSQRREDELSRRYYRFDLALSSMPHGLCMVDAAQRLVVCNRRFAEMYEVPPELTQPGTPLVKLLDHRIASGIYAGADAEAYRRERLGQSTEPSVGTCELRGGRTIVITRCPMAGGGWISIHEDVTERERLNARLAEQNERLRDSEKELKARNEQLDAALAHMVQGLALFDADQRLVLANARYSEFYGHGPGELAPGMTMREMIELRIAKGLYPGMSVDEVVTGMMWWARGETPGDRITRPGNGRVLSVATQPLSTGGRVVTLHDVSDLERLTKRLEAQNEQLDAALNNMSQGLAMFDAEQRLVLSNRRYAEMYGLTPEQVVPGTTVRQTLEYRCANGCYDVSDPQHFIDTIVEGFGRRQSAVHKLSDGRMIRVSYRSTASGGQVVTHDDITVHERLNAQLEQRNRLLRDQEEKLQQRNMQLDAALNNMVQGLAMFDSEQRLIVCNDLYARMYGLTPEQVKPGTTVRQIFDYRLANGFYHVSDSEKFVTSWASGFGARSLRVQELADGRIMAVSRAQTADGGRVVTHEDITERERLNAQLEEQHRLLKAHEQKLQVQNMQFDAALNNMMQGLAMFDPGQHIIVANKRYAEMYGLTPDDVQPGTHLRQIIERRIANGHLPGRSADEVLGALLGRTNAGGECQYVVRLHDGRYVAVSVQAMADGSTVTTHHDITEQRRSEAKILHMAMHDALTGLPNRILLGERLQHGLARVQRGDMLAVHLLDLDHFKNVNDTLGHPAGDKLLKSVAERLRLLVRDADTIARMGGDEFAILQEVIAQPGDATALAQRIIESVSEPYLIDGQQVIIGTSVGIAIGPADGTLPDQLVRNADLALYRAKGDGRGAFCFFEPGMDAKMQERRILEYDLRRALGAGEFELYYQPVVNLESNQISGMEALMRWRHPEKGLVSPANFIALAEEIGFIGALGDWAIRQACARAARWPRHVKVAVNLSPVQFRGAGLVQTVVGALAASGLAPDRLELEITETALLQESETTLAMLYQLRELGVGIALDDFGTGYSSLSYLQSFPFDRIKIDRSFIKDIGDGAGSVTIVRAVAALAAGLGMQTTAEGVETPGQRDAVKAEGCTEMQGFLFSRPRTGDEIEKLYFNGCVVQQDDRALPALPTVARAGAR